MTAAFLDFLGWDGLTAAEQAGALAGACLGLAAWLLNASWEFMPHG
jgi:hypothetical protein